MKLVTVLFENGPECQRALGDPRPVVENALRLFKGCEVDLDLRTAERSHALDALAEQAFGLAVTEKGEMLGIGNAEAESARARRHG